MSTEGGAGRRVGIDLVRVLGLIAVVAGHIIPGQFVRDLTFSWHVPVFFILAGYLWKPAAGSLVMSVLRRWRRVLVPYLAWMPIGLATWWIYLRQSGTPRSVGWLVDQGIHGGVRLAGPVTTYYFLSAFAIAVTVVLVGQRVSILVPLAIGLAACAYASGHSHTMQRWPLSAGTGLIGVLFIVVGIGLRRFLPRIPAKFVVGVAMVGGGLWLALGRYVKPVDLRPTLLGTPVLSVLVAILISAGLILWCEAIESRIPALIGRGIVGIAGLALPIFLFHFTIRDFVLLHSPHVDRYWLAVLAFAGSLLLGVLIRRTPLRAVLL